MKMTLETTPAQAVVPALIHGYGRHRGAELALLLRPDEGRTVVVRQKNANAGGLSETWAWEADGVVDAPLWPEESYAPDEALAMVEATRDMPTHEGPSALAGAWKAKLFTRGEELSVRLERDLGPDGVLKVRSEGEEWSWALWDKKEKQNLAEGEGYDRLSEAIRAGVRAALRLDEL